MNQNLRPLNDQELSLGLLASVAMHYLIRNFDQLKHTTLYRHKLKMLGNSFLKELESHQKENVWDDSPGNLDSASDQMENLTDMLHNLMMLALSMGHIHPAQQQLFWVDLQKSFNRFEIPLMITPEGSLELKYVKQ